MGKALALSCLFVFAGTVHGITYQERLDKATGLCKDIPPEEYQTGAVFNSPGKRSFYLRSACLQRVAIQFRSPALCEDVKQRHSLFFSSDGYSKDRCMELTRQGAEKDRQVLKGLKQAYMDSPVMLAGLRVERNGNGRDYDVIPVFAAGQPHAYRLSIGFANSGDAFVEQGFYLAEENNIRIHLPLEKLLEANPEFEPGSSCELQAKLEYFVGSGGQSGWWSEEFIEANWPVAQRVQQMNVNLLFE